MKTVRRTIAKPQGRFGGGACAWLHAGLASAHRPSRQFSATARLGMAATIPFYGNGATLRPLGLVGGGSG